MSSRASRATVVAVLVAAAAIGLTGGGVAGQMLPVADRDRDAAAPPTPQPTGAGMADTAISLSADPSSVSPNQDIRLAGALQPAESGVRLQIERSLDGGDWDTFPVTATTRGDGSFAVTVRTARSGENRFRVVGQVDGDVLTSDEVPVTIG